MRRNYSYAFLLALLIPLCAQAQQSFLPIVRATPGSSSRVLWGIYSSHLVRSEDLGVTWASVFLIEAGLTQPAVNVVVVDPTSAATVYAVTTVEAGSLLKTTDDGKTWAAANKGLPAEAGNFFVARNALYATSKGQLYKSVDQAGSWTLVGPLPTEGALAISDLDPTRMYLAQPSTLRVFSTLDEGRTWRPAGGIPTRSGAPYIFLSIAIPYPDPNTVFLSIDTDSFSPAVFRSTDGGNSFKDDAGSGLPRSTGFYNGASGPLYSVSEIVGFSRSQDGGKTWKDQTVKGGVSYNLTAVDPKTRTTIYGYTAGGSKLTRSTDSGDSWTVIPATISPAVAKPSSVLRLRVEEGAPYSQVLAIQAVENAQWTLPYTISTSGAAWLSLSKTSGTTPDSVTLTASVQGLKPGLYDASIKIDSPSSSNKSVTIPVQLTVLAAGSKGSRYVISTVAGNGGTTPTRNNGNAASIAVGTPTAVAMDPSGKVLFSTFEYLWQLVGTEAGTIAGTGVFGSTGDGGPPSQAQVNYPRGIAIDKQGTVYFSETGSKIRKISGGVISTVIDGSKFFFLGSQGIGFDSFNRLTLVDFPGVARFDGTKNVRFNSNFPAPFTGLSARTTALIIDAKDNIYISDNIQHVVFKVTPAGVPSVYAGTGTGGFLGDGGPATAAQLNAPEGLAMDAEGTLYVVDAGNNRIRAISPAGIIETIAGSGLTGFDGDGKTANFAQFNAPRGIAVDKQGNLYVGDSGNYRLRKLTLQSAPVPQISGLLHGASGDTKLSPGSLFSLYGTFAVTGQTLTGTTPWATSLAGVVVLINGVPAPLYFVSGTQINGQIPYETQAGQATAVVSVNGSAPAQATFSVIAANPGILVFNGDRAVAVNVDGGVNTASAPAFANDVELLYLTGIGQPDQIVATGAGAPSAPLARVKYPFSITLDGQPVEVFYLGLAPGYPALAQANFRVPDLPAKDYTLVVIVNGVPSNSTKLTIGTR